MRCFREVLGQMKSLVLPVRIVALICLYAASLIAVAAGVSQSFDADWRFFKGDAMGAEQPSFYDSTWRKLDVPHDWSIEGPFSKTNKTGGAGAWLPSGVGWYRKQFILPAEQNGKRVCVEFDGVMQNSEVWINGVSLGKRPNGYVSFSYDLTSYIKSGKGETNVIAVRADTSAQPASRWYSGAGIYRHVRLRITAAVHLEPYSLFVTTPVIQSNSATIHVEARVVNDSSETRKLTVMAKINSPLGSAANGVTAIAGYVDPISVAAGKSMNVKLDVPISWTTTRLWSLEKPELHEALITVREDEKVLDEETINFGVREARFDSTNGFVLNGKKVVIKGVCLHHEGGAFGAAVPNGVWEQRLKALRELGVNAIRTAHNPSSPDFLDLCDRMGFLVMDEFFDCWTVKKNPYDYALFFNEWSKRDAADTVRRDRNHPSVILYSIGNEIHDTPKPGIAIPIARGLVEVCHENDPTRPVTQALFRPNVSGDYTNGLADLLDVIGTNYRDNELLAAQRAKPERKIVGTEQRHDRQTWLWLRDNPSHSGQFIWVGVDYLGETKTWPRIAYPGGLLDRTGQIKPMAYERQSWWSDKPMVRMVRRVAANDVMPDDPGYGGEERHTQVQFADWTPRKQEAHNENVEVYSNCEDVELFLNGKSLGAKPINKDASPRVWKVAYEPGTLRAEGRNVAAGILPAVEPGFQPGGKNTAIATGIGNSNASVSSVKNPGGKMLPSTSGRMPDATDELRTAGKAARIVLSANPVIISKSWDDVSFVTATVVDENGVVVPRANDLITFTASDPGKVVAVDSGDNASIEPFQATERRAYQGRCVAAVKVDGSVGTKLSRESRKITVTATATGLKAGAVAIEVVEK